jgi:hypothetical protein
VAESRCTVNESYARSAVSDQRSADGPWAIGRLRLPDGCDGSSASIFDREVRDLYQQCPNATPTGS